MSPRAYNAAKRAEAVAETRRRITDAVVQLHREKGITGTSYEDIARAADVAPATVYRHFPTLDQLVPACGARILEITSPPGPALFDGLRQPGERLRALVGGLFAFWGRAEPWLTVGRSEEGKVPALQRDLRMQEQAVRALIRFALGEAVDDRGARLVDAMTDFYTWKAIKAAGLETEAAAIVTEMLMTQLGIKDQPGNNRRRKESV